MLTSHILLHVSVTLVSPSPGNVYGVFAKMNDAGRVFMSCIKVLSNSSGESENVSAGMSREAGKTGMHFGC